MSQRWQLEHGRLFLFEENGIEFQRNNYADLLNNLEEKSISLQITAIRNSGEIIVRNCYFLQCRLMYCVLKIEYLLLNIENSDN